MLTPARFEVTELRRQQRRPCGNADGGGNGPCRRRKKSPLSASDGTIAVFGVFDGLETAGASARTFAPRLPTASHARIAMRAGAGARGKV